MTPRRKLSPKDCPFCEGTGRLIERQEEGEPGYILKPCGECGGSGKRRVP